MTAAGSIGLKAIFTAEDRGVVGTVARMTAAIKGLNAAGEGLGKLDRFNNKLAAGLKTAAVAMGGVGLGAAVVAKNVIDAGADFEQAITNVGAVSLMTREQVAPLEKLALELGASTKFSATEVAGAMEMMGKAGFDNGQILEGVGGILSAAAADGAELAETASNISNVLKGMGLATTETARVADVLTLASARTNSSISSLGESMANVSSTARQLGVPLEDTVAMVALLQDVGLDASEAGSAVATMLTKMSAPSKDAAAQMAAMGVKFDDAAGNMLAPAKVLEQLVKAGTKAGGNMKQVAFFADLVGLRGQKAALNLKDLFKSGKVTSLVDELKGAAGSAEKMSGIRMDTFKGDIETLGGSVDSLKIKLFDMQDGPLRGVVKGTTEWLDANSDLIAGGLNDFIKEALPLLDNFKDGVLSAGENALPFIKGVGGFLTTLSGNDSKNARMEAFLIGESIAKWGIRWVEFSIAVKGARVAVFLFGNAAKIAKGIAIAWEFTMGTLKSAMYAYQVATGIGTANTVAFGGAMTTATVGAEGLTAATAATGGAMDSLAVKAGAVGLALAAAYAAYDQGSKFLAENGGWEGVKAFVGAGDDPTSFGRDAVLEMQNRQARERRAAEDAGVPKFSETVQGAPMARAFDKMGMPAAIPLTAPGGYAAAFGQPPTGGTLGMAPPPAAPPPAAPAQSVTRDELSAAVKQSLEVTIKTPEGTSAEVTKKPSGAKVNLQPSGSFY